MHYFFRLKIACHNAHILKNITDSSLKMLCVVFCQAHFMLIVLRPTIFCKPEQREDNS